MLFRTRDQLVRQRTQTISALRGHLTEFGVVAPQGRAKITQLVGVLEDADSALPEAVVELGRLLLERIDGLDEKIDGLDSRLRARARENCTETARLMTIPGIGPITALAIQAFAPPMESFRSGREFSAWLGLVPRQHTTGGKPRLGRVSKMGQRDLRRLLITGAMAVSCRMTRRRKERSESREAVGRCGQDVGTGKGKRSTRRGRKNQDASEGHGARDSDLDPISRTPYGPAANKGCIKWPDIRQYLTWLPRSTYDQCPSLGYEVGLAKNDPQRPA